MLGHGEVTGTGPGCFTHTHTLTHTHIREQQPVAGDAERMNGAAVTILLLLLLSGRAAFTAARSLNAPQDGEVPPPDGQTDGTDSLTAAVTGVDRWRRPLLQKTRPFVLVDGRRRSLTEALQDGHPDRLQCGLEVGGRLFLLDLEKNHDLLPKPPNVFYYLPNGTGVSVRADPVTHCYYHGSVRGFPQSRAALSTCSGLRVQDLQ